MKLLQPCTKPSTWGNSLANWAGFCAMLMWLSNGCKFWTCEYCNAVAVPYEAFHSDCLSRFWKPRHFDCVHMISLCDYYLQYIPRNMHTDFALLCFVVVIHWLIFPYPSGLLHWHLGNLTIAPVPAKQPWWIWINTSCEFIMNDCITTTKQSTTKPCAYFFGYTVNRMLVWQTFVKSEAPLTLLGTIHRRYDHF